MAPLELGDPLAHRALQALLRAETSVRRQLAADLEREGVSAAGFSALVVLTTAGGGAGAAGAAPPPRLVEGQRHRGHASRSRRAGWCARRRLAHDRRAAAVDLLPAGRSLVERLFPGHADRVTDAFSALDEEEKRSLAEICRKLAA